MLSARMQIFDQDARTTSTTQGGAALGQQGQTDDGRTFRYGQAGLTALAPGKMNDGAVVVANHVNLVTAAAAAVGATQVTVTLAGTAATLNQYAGGMLWCNVTSTGLGIGYLIQGNPAQATTTGNLVVTLVDPIQTAITTSTKTSLFPALYSGAIVTPSAATAGGPPIGVFTGSSLPISGYGWFQTGGPCPLLSDATVYTLGEEVSQAASGVAGSGSLKVATLPTYGVAMQLGVSGQYQLVNLSLN